MVNVRTEFLWLHFSTKQKKEDTLKTITLCVCMLLAMGTLLAGAPKHNNYVVNISYYSGDGEFTITTPQWEHFSKGDTITYHTDDPGRLILRLDNGTIYSSLTGEITFTAQQLAHNKKVRCSMLTPDGQLLGWEVDHDDQYGGGTPPPDISFWQWLLSHLP